MIFTDFKWKNSYYLDRHNSYTTTLLMDFTAIQHDIGLKNYKTWINLVTLIFVISDRFCGSILSCNHGDTANRGVLTSAKPFGFRVYFNNAGDDNSGDRGFALNYRQEMCWLCSDKCCILFIQLGTAKIHSNYNEIIYWFLKLSQSLVGRFIEDLNFFVSSYDCATEVSAYICLLQIVNTPIAYMYTV